MLIAGNISENYGLETVFMAGQYLPEIFNSVAKNMCKHKEEGVKTQAQIMWKESSKMKDYKYRNEWCYLETIEAEHMAAPHVMRNNRRLPALSTFGVQRVINFTVFHILSLLPWYQVGQPSFQRVIIYERNRKNQKLLIKNIH